MHNNTCVRLLFRLIDRPAWRVVGATAHPRCRGLGIMPKPVCLILFALAVSAMLPVAAANRYWIAPGGDWSDAANWSTSSGGSGGAAVPASGDIAIFDGYSGDALMNVAVDIAGLTLATNYTGVVRQTDKTVNIRASGYYQGAGCFSGGGAAITVTLNNTAGIPFKMIGGVFTNSALYLRINHSSGSDQTTMQLHGGAFVSNDGAMQFYTTSSAGNSKTFTIDVRIPLNVPAMQFLGGNTQGGGYYRAFALSLSGAGEINILNDLTFTPSGSLRLNGGVINLYGNLNAAAGMYSGTTKIRFASSSDQEYEVAGGRLPHFVIDKPDGAVIPVNTKDLSISSFELLAGDFFAPSGTLDVAYSVWDNYDIFIIADGNFHHNNGTLRFSTSSTTQSDRSSTIRLNKALELNNLSFISGHSNIGRLSYVVSLNNGATLHVLGDLTIKPSAARYFKINSGTIKLDGDYLINTGSEGGSATIALIGGMDQTVTHAGGTPPQGALTINKPDGAVCLATPLALSGSSQDLSWQSGDLSLGTNTLSVGRHLNIGATAGNVNTTIAAEGVAGKIAVSGKASGIENATLCVDAPRSARDDTKDRTYTILSNNTALSGELAAVRWGRPWLGKVNYTANGGKNITIFDFMFRYPGTVLAVQ